MTAPEPLVASRAALKAWIEARCLFTSDQEILVNSRGERQAWMFDLRPLLLDSWATTTAAELFWAKLGSYWPFQLAAQELAGAPLLGTLLAVGAAKGFVVSGVIVRKERKSHGRQRNLEGNLTDLPVVVVDDIVNSGSASRKTLAVLKCLGAHVTHAFSLLDFGQPAAAALFADINVSKYSIFTLNDFGLSAERAPSFVAEAPPLAFRWDIKPKLLTYNYVARKAAPVVFDGCVYHATQAGWLHAIDLATGAPIWERRLARRPKGIWSTPLATDDAVYVGSYDGIVYRLDRTTGADVWRYEGADWVGSSPCLDTQGELLYIGLEYAVKEGTGAIAALYAETGDLAWCHNVPAQVHASPVVLPTGNVVCGGNDGQLRSLDGRTGALKWIAELGGDIKSAATPGPRGLRVFAGSCDSAVYGVNSAEGAIEWRQETDGEVYAPPMFADGYVYAASTDGAVYKFGAGRGRRFGKRIIGGKLFAGPIRDGDTMLVGSTSGRLARLRLDDLSVVAMHEFEERITSEVAVASGALLVPLFDGQLIAVENQPG